MKTTLFLFLLLNIGLTLAAVPVFSGITALSVSESTDQQTLLGTFTVTDPDGGTVTACNHAGPHDKFDIQQRSGNPTWFDLYVLGSAGLDYDTANSYTLVTTCTDSAAETATENIQIDVTPNQPPTITAPTSTFSVSENEVAQRVIYVLTVTDPETDPFSCSISVYPVPSPYPFGIWKDPTDYTVFLLNNPGLSYSSAYQSYTITVTCSDDHGDSNQPLTVVITPNQPPTFTNTPYSTSLDASTVQAGGAVFTVTTQDTDSTSLTFSLTANPASPILFDINSLTGAIEAAKDLLYATTDTHYLSVTVSDTKDTATEIITVTLTNTNTAPVINNLPDVKSIAEDAAAGTVIITLDTTDPDTGDNESVTYTVTPSGFSNKFSYNSSTREFSLATGATLDYELQNSFSVDFTIADDYADTGPYTLTINVTNVNEACVFSVDTYHATLEESDVGIGSADPGIAVTDDSSSYTLDLVTSSVSSYFSLVSANNVSLAVNYDVDGAHPNNATLLVRCTDDHPVTSTATLSLTILDVNDNTPEFGSTGYVYYIDQYDKPGGTVATITATDLDSGDNGDVEYSWTPAGGNVYHLNSVGTIILQKDPLTMTYGDTYDFVVTARDQGSPVLSSTTTVHIVYKEVTTTTTTTTAAPVSKQSFWDDGANVAVVVLACLLALAALALLAYFLWKYCFKGGNQCNTTNCCKPRPSRRHVGPKPSPPGNKFDYWHEDNMHRPDGSLMTTLHGPANTRAKLTPVNSGWEP